MVVTVEKTGKTILQEALGRNWLIQNVGGVVDISQKQTRSFFGLFNYNRFVRVAWLIGIKIYTRESRIAELLDDLAIYDVTLIL